jgi:hypothetical protein
MINHCDRRITYLGDMMSDTSITVIYHAMSLTVHITKISDTSITVIYHAMSLTVHITVRDIA